MSAQSNKVETDEIASAFLAENAEFFAQAFAPLNSVFETAGPMRIVSEESDMTVVVGVGAPDVDGGMSVDCILLDQAQESLRDCMDALDYES